MGSTPLEGQWDAEPVDIPRYMASLRRSRGLIFVIVASMTAAVFVISSMLPKTYETSGRIVMDDRPGGAEPADAATVQRRLATVGALITTREVRARAAARLKGETSATLEDKVRATVDEDANIVEIHATDNDPQGAAEIANTLAREFIEMQRTAERQRLARARTALQSALARLRTPQSPQADAIRDRLTELRVSEAAAGSELELAEPAQPPRTASSPRPIRNAIFALFASVFLAVLAALGLGQLAPRVAGTRDLGLLTGVPVVAHVPRARRRRDLQTVNEAYEELQTALALRLSTESKIVVVSGAQPTDETSAVAAGLARTLAESGRTLLLSADLWRPHVHEVLGLPRSPGLAELLSSGEGDAPSALARAAHSIDVGEGSLDVLTAGGPVRNPAGLLGTESFANLVLELECSDYRHVVVEAPALLGSVHAQLVARYADAMLVVCDPERLSPSDAVELGHFLSALDPPFAGLLTLGRGGAAAVPVVSAPPRRTRAQADV
jgi:polysaccharide biosynthesis transport protein